MPNIIHLPTPALISGRSISSPAMFESFPSDLQAELRKKAIRRNFSPGQFVYHRGDAADGFWIIEQGQIKLGHQDAQGNVHVLCILGPKDSFGELACLGQFDRVLDAEALDTAKLLWVGDAIFSEILTRSPDISRQLLRVLALQLQEALDDLLIMRNLSASKRLAQRLLAFAAGHVGPVKLDIRQQQLAELIGVSRMTIASTLAELGALGLVTRHYGHLTIEDPAALQRWMKDEPRTIA